MLRKLTLDEFDQIAPFVYEVALDLSKTSFPVYNDGGVKTRDYFLERSLNGLQREDEEILLFEQDEHLQGWIHYYRLDDDRCLSLAGISVREGFAAALEELLAYWKQRFPGYFWQFYLPEENREGIAFLERYGCPPPSKETVNTLMFERYTPRPDSPAVFPIDETNYEIFRRLHSRFDETMYWNSDRILQDLKHWTIFAHGEQGVIYYRSQDDSDLEIFGLDFPEDSTDLAVAEALLTNCLNYAKFQNARSMYLFADEPTARIAAGMGFQRITTACYFEGRLE